MTSIARIYDKLDMMDKRIILKAIRERGWAFTELRRHQRYMEAARKREYNLIGFMKQKVVYEALKEYSNAFHIHDADCNVDRYLRIRKMMTMLEDEVLSLQSSS